MLGTRTASNLNILLLTSKSTGQSVPLKQVLASDETSFLKLSHSESKAFHCSNIKYSSLPKHTQGEDNTTFNLLATLSCSFWSYLEFSSVSHDPLPNLLWSCSFDDQIARILLRSTEEMKGKLWLFSSSSFCLFQEAKSNILPFDHNFSRKKPTCVESKVAHRFIWHCIAITFHHTLTHNFH